MANSSTERNKKGRCFLCIKAMKWVPVLFILTIIVWSYYAYVVQLCVLTVQPLVKKIIYIVLYHGALVMFCWSYWQTIFTDIGTVPSKFKLPEAEYDRLMHAFNEDMQRNILENFSKDLPNTNYTLNGAMRYCEKCRHIKPDRAHHCSVCGECVLKMDHHCPWINNCVCFTNYKFFILFLGYSLIYCIYIALTSLQYFISFWKGDLGDMGKFHILFLFFVALMFAISLVSLFGYHCYLVAHNRTTLEAFRPAVFRTGPDKNGFSLGMYNNFQEVFGDNPHTWLLPLKTSLGDGVLYPVQSRHQPSTYRSMDTTQTSLGDGHTFPQRHVEEDAEQLLANGQHSDDELTVPS